MVEGKAEDGSNLNMLHVENIQSLLGRKIQVTMEIKSAQSLPPKFCSDVFASYKWVDETADTFQTKSIPEAIG